MIFHISNLFYIFFAILKIFLFFFSKSIAANLATTGV